MKAISLGSLLVLSTAFSTAQTITPIAPAKGAYSAGFSIQYFKGQHTDSITLFQVTPAYFVTDHLEVRFPFALDRGFNADETVVGLGLRWHFGKKRALLDPFVGAVAEHATARNGFREDFFGGILGANYFIANNVAVVGVFQLGSDRTKLPDEATTNFGIGLAVFFAGK